MDYATLVCHHRIHHISRIMFSFWRVQLEVDNLFCKNSSCTSVVQAYGKDGVSATFSLARNFGRVDQCEQCESLYTEDCHYELSLIRLFEYAFRQLFSNS